MLSQINDASNNLTYKLVQKKERVEKKHMYTSILNMHVSIVKNMLLYKFVSL
jgi:hypothetical protein